MHFINFLLWVLPQFSYILFHIISTQNLKIFLAANTTCSLVFSFATYAEYENKLVVEFTRILSFIGPLCCFSFFPEWHLPIFAISVYLS